MKRYELIDHTADIAIRAYGDSLGEAFAAAADALFEIITGESPIMARETITVKVESIDREGVLVGFLSELLVRFEVDRLVLKDFNVSFDSENKLTAMAKGATFDEKIHGHGYHVKGVSYHMMDIFDGESKGVSHVQVLFDI